MRHSGSGRMINNTRERTIIQHDFQGFVVKNQTWAQNILQMLVCKHMKGNILIHTFTCVYSIP